MSAEPRAPVVSVVIPTYNRRDRLERVLRSLAAQDLDEDFEVIVVSDGSSDGTDEYLSSGATPLPVIASTQSNQGPAAARNRGTELATAALVLYLDDDVVADAGLLRAHLDAQRRFGERTVVIGPMLDPPDHPMSRWVAWEQAMLAKQYDAMDRGVFGATARQFYTGNASVRTANVRAVGGFDADFRRAEDIELAFRLADIGLDFHFERSAIGLHYAERSYEAWRQTAYAYGRNDMVFARDRGREWLFEFVRNGYWQHHAAVRWLTARSLRSARWRRWSMQLLELVVRVPGAGRPARYALSGVYAIEYHRGVADELGSIDAFEALIGADAPR